MTVKNVSRRGFLASLGIGAGALTLSASLPRALARRVDSAFAPNVFLSIAQSGVVTIVVSRSEMGQGVRTSIPMVIADELEADWAQVKVAQAKGDAIYGNQNTDGSRSIRTLLPTLRMAGATAREMLITAAAKQWRIPRSRCIARDHSIVDGRTKRSLSFGALVARAHSVPVPKPAAVRLKKPSDFRYIGKSKPIVDGGDLVTGKAQFGADVSRPNMLVAVIARPPAVGAEVEKFDKAAALAVKGVVKVALLPVTQLPSGFAPLGGVAVLANNTWAAIRGRKALAATWKASPHDGYDSAAFRKTLEASASKASAVGRQTGDVDGALAAASKKLTSRYYVPHLAQAPMEPPVALAHVVGDRCECWTSIQTPQSARREVAGALGIPASAVTINVTLLGGGFGRKSKPDFVVEAALLSRAAGVPVRVQWTREDDIRHGFFHTVSAQQVEGGIDKSGKVTAWRHRTAFPPIGGTFAPTTSPGASELAMGLTDLPLAIDNVEVLSGDADVHLRIGWMRSVANIYHAFAVSSFVDELAALAGRDPKLLWLELLAGAAPLDLAKLGVAKPWNYGERSSAHRVSPTRLRRVIEVACKRADWTGRRAKGRALGLAAHRSFASYVATIIEVSGTAADFKIERAVSVIDAGLIVSRDRVLAQLEGAITYGLSAALYGQITATDGRVDQSNFHDYRMLRIGEAPRDIDVSIIDSSAPPGGVGEPGMPPVAPALANALFALTGKRERTLPLRAPIA